MSDLITLCRGCHEREHLQQLSMILKPILKPSPVPAVIDWRGVNVKPKPQLRRRHKRRVRHKQPSQGGWKAGMYEGITPEQARAQVGALTRTPKTGVLNRMRKTERFIANFPAWMHDIMTREGMGPAERQRQATRLQRAYREAIARITPS